jgi:hypothetical protein
VGDPVGVDAAVGAGAGAGELFERADGALLKPGLPPPPPHPATMANNAASTPVRSKKLACVVVLRAWLVG